MIDGIKIIKKANYSVFYFESFSDEMKSIIRTQLQGIYHGFAEIDLSPEFYSYKNTLSSFLDRYEGKADDTKKGMIGELLLHVIFNHLDFGIKSLSILKNKEERSIKKGFDVIYCEIDNKKLWYTEIKSGKSEDGSVNSSTYNKELLNRAKVGISTMFSESRNSRWESALIDVSLTIKESNGLIDLKKLLANDSPSIGGDDKKNVILVSVLYHDLADRIEEATIDKFCSDTIAEDIFLSVMGVSIQKSTYEKVAQFLRDEITA